MRKGLDKPTQRVIKELIYGIQAAKDVKIPSVARSLQEDIALIKTEDGKESIFDLTFGITKVAMYDKPDQWMKTVVIKGFGQHPMILLTNKEPDSKEPKDVYKIVEIYLTRSKCDECFRYSKQSCNLEYRSVILRKG